MSEHEAVIVSAGVAAVTSITAIFVSNFLTQRKSRLGIRRNLVGTMRELAVWTESCRNELGKRGEFGTFADAYRDNVKALLDGIRGSEVAQVLSDAEYQSCYSAASTGMLNSFANTNAWGIEDRQTLMARAKERLEAAQKTLGDSNSNAYSPWLSVLGDAAVLRMK